VVSAAIRLDGARSLVWVAGRVGVSGWRAIRPPDLNELVESFG